MFPEGFLLKIIKSRDCVVKGEHTVQTLNDLKKKPIENVGKGKLLVSSIFPFPTLFSTPSMEVIIMLATFILSSANAMNLAQKFVVW